ncbi:MAG: winged helix-turn-helix domain-containing protein, partial [Gemmatimonadota bacterium]|nr:winged helix-turn-helix domain-containing protein [Gemmatimonadota bacterium]
MLRTLGPLRLMEGVAEVAHARRMELALLAYLVRRSPAAATRAELATLMWGERGEERARHSLRQSLSALRRLVGGALEVAGERVRIAPGSIALD